MLRSAATLTRRSALTLTAATLLPFEGQAADRDTINVAYPFPVATLDPAKFRIGGLEYNYAICVFSRLTKQDEKLQVQPDLATRWEPGADLRSWTFHLRQGVKFHDGKAFTADDVVFTYKRLQDKEIGSVLRANLDVVTNVVAVDPHTVRFDLSIPYADLPAVVAGYQAPILSEAGMATLTTKPVGTGPYRFVEYRPGDRMVLERNPDYFLPGVPKTPRAVFHVIPEYPTAIAGLESGTLDIVYDVPPELADKLKRSTAATLMTIPSGTWQGIVLHNQIKPFDDPRVRRAFLKLVDKPAITEIAMFGYGASTITPIPPSHPYYRKDISLGPDIAGAKKLLAEAGVGPMSLDLWVQAANPAMERLAIALRDQAKQVGFNLQIRVMPSDKFFAEMAGKVPLFLVNFFGRTTPDLMLFPWYHSTGSWNNTLWHYNNAEVDRLLETARTTADPAQQAQLYGRFQEIIADDGPGSIVFVKSFACGVSKRVSGFTPSPLNLIDISGVTLA